ncbi:MAG TPA: LamG domain-containing protein, partial [Bacteroidales bacterium]|nr:LamG domain-containing protein [Bacteroidales bacterium]
MKKRFLLSYFWYFLIAVGLFSFSAVNIFAQTDNAMQLPGVDGNSSNVDITGLNITTLPFTMEMWIKPEGTQTDNTAIIFNRPGNLGIQYSSSWQGSGKLRFMTGISGDYGVVSGGVSTDVWHHVAVVLTDTTRAIYIDGVKTEEKGTYAANDYSAGNTYIGWDSDAAARAFKGLIDEVRVWNVVRDSADLAGNKYNTLSGTETGLIGYWNFNSVNATTAVDATGNLDGVITGGTYVEKKPEITLSASDTVEIEKGYPAFNLFITTANLNDSVFITAPAGFTVTPDTIPAADIHIPNYKVVIDVANASAGDKGAIVFTYKNNDVVTGLDTLQVKAIEPYTRFYIQQIASDLVIGSRTTDATIPVLSRLVPGDSSQLFSLRPVNPGSNDSIYYIVEDAGYSYLSKQASSGWNTVLGPLEDGEWKITLENGGFYSLKNVVKNYLASDGTTSDSRLYADKALAGNDNAHFDFLRATAVDSANARLSSIEVDGTAVTGFDFDTLSYAVELPAGTTTVPAVTATAGNTNADVAVTAAAALPGTTTVTVTAVDGTTTRTYFVDFTVAIDPTKDATLSTLSTD